MTSGVECFTKKIRLILATEVYHKNWQNSLHPRLLHWQVTCILVTMYTKSIFKQNYYDTIFLFENQSFALVLCIQVRYLPIELGRAEYAATQVG